METTVSSETGGLDLESAVAHIIEPEEAPEVEEVSEEETTQPEEDVVDESEDLEDADESDASEEDDVEETDESDDVDDEDEEDDEPDQEDPELITVKVNGEEVKVSLEDLKRDYSGQQYIQQGMQKAAEAKKEAEGVYSALMQERQHLAQLIQQAQNGQLSLTPPVEPDISMLETAPFEYLTAKEKYEKDFRQYQQTMAQVQQQMQTQSVAQQRAEQAYAVQEAQALVQKIPELSDASKAAKWQQNLFEGAQKYYNYTAEQVGMIRNHQDFITLSNAIKYAELMEGKAQAKDKVQKAKPAIKPGPKKVSNRAKAERAAKDRARKSGDLNDMLALLVNPNLK